MAVFFSFFSFFSFFLFLFLLSRCAIRFAEARVLSARNTLPGESGNAEYENFQQRRETKGALFVQFSFKSCRSIITSLAKKDEGGAGEEQNIRNIFF